MKVRREANTVRRLLDFAMRVRTIDNVSKSGKSTADQGARVTCQDTHSHGRALHESEQKRIFVFYHDDPEQNKGSAAKYVWAICSYLTQFFTVDLYVYSDMDTTTKLAAPGFRLHKISRRRVPLLSKMPRVGANVANAIAALNPELYFFSKHSGRPDVCLCVDPYASLLPGIFYKLAGVQQIYRPNDGMSILANEFWSNGQRILSTLVFVYGFITETLLLRISTIILPPSRRVAEVCRRSLGSSKKILVLPPFIDDPKPPVEGEREKLRSTLGMPPTAKILVFVGSARWLPNQLAIEYIITQLAPFLWSESKEALIYIVGEHTEAYRSQVKTGNIIVVGGVASVDDYLKAADIGLAPMSLVGGISGKAIEYLSFGLPVAVTQGVADTLEPQPGIYVAPISEFHKLVLKLIRAENLPPRSVIASTTVSLYKSNFCRLTELVKDLFN